MKYKLSVIIITCLIALVVSYLNNYKHINKTIETSFENKISLKQN